MTGVRIKSRTMAVKGRDTMSSASPLPMGSHAHGPDGPSAIASVHSAVPTDAPLSFSGRWPALFLLALKNTLLTWLTIGIYRFWAKTHLRRYFWNNTRLDGEALEYTGTVKELFIGFLIAVVLLGPLVGSAYLLDALVLLENLRDDTGEAESATRIGVFNAVGLMITVFLALLAYPILYRLWSYRVSRTSWRGVAFVQAGSMFRYGLMGIGWGLLSLVTLGLAYPWKQRALWAYRIKHMGFGSTRFTFTPAGAPPLVPWLFVLLGPAVAALLYFSATVLPSIVSVDLLFSLTWVYVALALVSSTAYVWYRTAEFRYVAASTSFGETTFTSHASAPRICGYFVLCAALFSLIVGAAVLIFFFETAFLSLKGVPLSKWTSTLLPGVLVGFVGLVSFAFIKTSIFSLLLAKHVAQTTDVSTFTPFDDVIRSDQPTPRHGEGFADALDLAG